MTTLKNIDADAPNRSIFPHDGTLVFEIHVRTDRYVRCRSLRFNPQNGHFEEFGKRVHQLAKDDVEFLLMAAPWTATKYC